MTKRRVRLGSGLDPQKLTDTIQQAFDAFEQMPGLSINAHAMEDGWLHLYPKAGFDAEGEMTHVIGWLLTFGYPHEEAPEEKLAGLKSLQAGGVKLAAWEVGLYASYWLPPGTPAEELAGLAIALAREVQGVADGAHVEVALEFGL
jgi:hypothetical protein